MKILLVCLGNICRSPLAEGILREKFLQHKLNHHVDSAGTSSWHEGDAPDNRTVEVARKNGIDVSRLRGRQIKKNDFSEFDLILAMDDDNYEDIILLAKSEDERNKVFYFLGYAGMGEKLSVPDPYYGGTAGFDSLFKLLDKACDHIADKLKI